MELTEAIAKRVKVLYIAENSPKRISDVIESEYGYIAKGESPNEKGLELIISSRKLLKEKVEDWKNSSTSKMKLSFK